MVRCKSLVEGMRVLIVDIMSRERENDEHGTDTTDRSEQTATDTEADSYTDNESTWGGEEGREHDMDVARVFEKTIVQLGESLKDNTGYDVGV
jgi:hypothetical protein